jgi:hypothetical protein
VPNGQIHPHHTLPKTSVRTSVPSAKAIPVTRARLASRFAKPIKGSKRRKELVSDHDQLLFGAAINNKRKTSRLSVCTTLRVVVQAGLGKIVSRLSLGTKRDLLNLHTTEVTSS